MHVHASFGTFADANSFVDGTATVLASVVGAGPQHFNANNRVRATRMNTDTERREQQDRQVALMTAVARDKDKEAFRKLFDHFAPRLQGFLMGSGSDPHLAEEIAQEAMVSVWRKAQQFDPDKAAVSTWIFTIARNARIDHLRRAKRPEPDVNDPAFASEPEPQPHDLVSQEQEATRLRRIIAQLPEEQQVVLRLAYFEEKPHSEVAKELDIPLGTVKSRIRLAIGRIRTELGDVE